jgi:hypothetical protein
MKKRRHAGNAYSKRRRNSFANGGLTGLRTKVFFILLSLFVFVILEAAPISAQSLKSVVFAVSSTDVSASPIFVAEELGYLERRELIQKLS